MFSALPERYLQLEEGQCDIGPLRQRYLLHLLDTQLKEFDFHFVVALHVN